MSEGRLGFAAAAAAALLGAWLWLASGIAALLGGSSWMSLPTADLAALAVRLPEHLSDLALAWPRAQRAALPGPIGIYLALVLSAVVIAGALYGGRRAARRFGLLGDRRRNPPSARWARRADLAPLRVPRTAAGRVTLGRSVAGLLAAEERQSVIVVAPTQSGKTTGLAIPALLEWQGPVLATSIKSDLLRDSLARRSELGEVMVFDPAQVTGVASTRVNPLGSCGSWRGALRVAHWLAASARAASGGLAESEFWYATAEKLLAPMLFAAAGGGETMATVVRWLDAGPEASDAEVAELLRERACEEATWAWGASQNREERQRSSVFTTAEMILAAFADPRVIEETAAADYTPSRLLDGRMNTLYLCAPAHEQQRLRTLFATIISELLAVAYESAAASGPLDPPLLLVLDEAANIAPISNLDEVASTGAGQGVQLVSVFQDLAQLRSRYGDRAKTIVNNHRAKLFGAGVSDPETLRYVSEIVGPGEFEQRSRSEGPRAASTSTKTYRDLVGPMTVRGGKVGSALLIYGHLPPTEVRLRPWYEEKSLRALGTPDSLEKRWPEWTLKYETVPLVVEGEEHRAEGDSPWSGAAVPLGQSAEEGERALRLELIAARHARRRRWRRVALCAGIAAVGGVFVVLSIESGRSADQVAGTLSFRPERALRPDAVTKPGGQRTHGRRERRHRVRRSAPRKARKRPAGASAPAPEAIAEVEPASVQSAAQPAPAVPETAPRAAATPQWNGPRASLDSSTE